MLKLNAFGRYDRIFLAVGKETEAFGEFGGITVERVLLHCHVHRGRTIIEFNPGEGHRGSVFSIAVTVAEINGRLIPYDSSINGQARHQADYGDKSQE